VRVKAQIVIPGENRARERGSREGDLGGPAAWVSKVDDHSRALPSRSPMLRPLGPLSLVALRAAGPGMTGGSYPRQFPKVRMGTLATQLREHPPARFARGEGGGRFRENNDQDRVVLGAEHRDVVPWLLSGGTPPPQFLQTNALPAYGDRP